MNMTNEVNLTMQQAPVENKCYYVVHPLDAQPEQKRQVDGLGRMPLSPVVKYSLLSLRFYLLFMGGLVFYRALQETGLL